MDRPSGGCVGRFFFFLRRRGRWGGFSVSLRSEGEPGTALWAVRFRGSVLGLAGGPGDTQGHAGVLFTPPRRWWEGNTAGYYARAWLVHEARGSRPRWPACSLARGGSSLSDVRGQCEGTVLIFGALGRGESWSSEGECSDPWGSVEPWAGGHRYTTCLVESDHGRRATLPLRIAYLSTDHGPIAPCQDATIQWHRGARRRRGGAAARFGAPRLAARPTRRHSRLPTASGPRRMADEGAGWDQRGRPLIHGAAPWGAARSRAMGQRRTAAQPGAARGIWG